jgi:hypothetical protein
MDSFGPIPFTDSLEESLAAFITEVRREASRGPVRWRIALFAKDTHGWRTVVLDPSGMNDLDAMIIWSMNRMARILDAPAAAFTDESGADGGVVYVERRDARALERHALGRGERDDVSFEVDAVFDVLPGGSRAEGWGWQDHAEIEIDYGFVTHRRGAP